MNAIGLSIAKYLYKSNRSITAFEITTTRAFFQILFNQVIIEYNGLSYRVITLVEFKKLIFRFALGYPAWTMLFYSVKVLPVGLSQTIQNLTPFFTLIFAYILLKEQLKKLEVINMFAAFGGVLIMIGLGSLAGTSSSDVSL